MESVTTLFIIDDHQMMIDGIKMLLINSSKFKIVGETCNPKEAIQLIAKLQPHIVITDVSMPHITGAELTLIIKKQFPTIKILALSMHHEYSIINNLMQAGVDGYILKDKGTEELITALTAINNGESYYSQKVINEMDISNLNTAAALLTARELQVVNLMAKEYNNAQIAELLTLSERTVETHRKNIFKKTNTKTIVGLIKMAYDNKWIH
jgi:two-component system, NarL family, nitrate/nitrite response regulator NarL